MGSAACLLNGPRPPFSEVHRDGTPTHGPLWRASPSASLTFTPTACVIHAPSQQIKLSCHTAKGWPCTETPWPLPRGAADRPFPPGDSEGLQGQPFSLGMPTLPGHLITSLQRRLPGPRGASSRTVRPDRVQLLDESSFLKCGCEDAAALGPTDPSIAFLGGEQCVATGVRLSVRMGPLGAQGSLRVSLTLP